MVSSIEVDDETRVKLDKLREHLIGLGKKVSLQDLIELLVRGGYRILDVPIEFSPMDPSVIDDVLSLSSNSKFQTTPEILDDLMVAGMSD